MPLGLISLLYSTICVYDEYVDMTGEKDDRDTVVMSVCPMRAHKTRGWHENDASGFFFFCFENHSDLLISPEEACRVKLLRYGSHLFSISLATLCT